MTYDQWLELGINNSWCGPPVCYTHDGLPTTEDEDLEFDELDPCIHIIRLYEDHDHAQQIHDNHSATQWRLHNRKAQKK
jgi:hypothetical protein